MDAVFRVAPVGPSGLVGFWFFRPVGVTWLLPTLFYVHGGRWMLGDAQTHARRSASSSGTWRTPPSFPSTAALPRLGIPWRWRSATTCWPGPSNTPGNWTWHRLAGRGRGLRRATLATALTMLARARGGSAIRLNPATTRSPTPAAATVTPSSVSPLATRSPDKPSTGTAAICAGPGQLAEPTASPLRATRADLTGLPALVVTAEADVAKDEGKQYARRLRDADVEVTAVRVLGTVHDFVSLNALRDSPPTRAAVRQGCDFLRAKLS